MFDTDQAPPTISTFGRKGSTIDYSGGDVSLSASVKAVFVTSPGDVTYRPRGETEGSITMTGMNTGQLLYHIPGIIFQTGTTAGLATSED